MVFKEMKRINNNGLALPIILILLLVMTILGVTALSNSSVQERMTASQQLRTLAFNFAETTLREAEEHAKDIAENIRTGSLSTQSGATFRFFSLIEDLTANPNWKVGFPSESEDNPGDFCTGGYCTPVEHDSTGTKPTTERWMDASVWSDTEKHRVLSGFDADDLLEQDLAQAPQYIIEFLGQLPVQKTIGDPESAVTKCPSSGAPNDGYPYCPNDPYFFRITSRVVSGSGGRESVVMLQSTVVVD